eukprot:scaffold97022_cov26-Tisochrysis_lutea.AAC.2
MGGRWGFELPPVARWLLYISSAYAALRAELCWRTVATICSFSRAAERAGGTSRGIDLGWRAGDDAERGVSEPTEDFPLEEAGLAPMTVRRRPAVGRRARKTGPSTRSLYRDAHRTRIQGLELSRRARNLARQQVLQRHRKPAASIRTRLLRLVGKPSAALRVNRLDETRDRLVAVTEGIGRRPFIVRLLERPASDVCTLHRRLGGHNGRVGGGDVLALFVVFAPHEHSRDGVDRSVVESASPSANACE